MPAVVPPEKWRHVELAEEYRLEWPNWGNEMVEHLKTWQSSWRMAAAHAEAVKKAKLLLPDDVGRVEFENVLMLRNKVGAVTIKETK
jgi:hypothetical protein